MLEDKIFEKLLKLKPWIHLTLPSLWADINSKEIKKLMKQRRGRGSGVSQEEDGGESSTKRKQKGGSNNASSSTVGNDDWLEEFFNFDVATEAMTQESQQTVDSSQATTQQSQAYGPDIGHEEDPELRPKIVSESQTRLKARKLQVRPPTGTRRIQFIEGEDRVSMPTHLPYSPTKITWRGNAALTPSQLATQAIRKRIKIGSKGKEAVAPDSVRQ
ncbi:hypothetical protein K7X08_029359 [Anisodus acutangulus]|uniref:Uncharacterized protein n=1 Tax=Anisodus acutangulus TaxID=402998 RepID=A0A9Q1L515_9SOLA|nr:hypothetical protein K7X08_029359 [Anisodus acutangulus]